MSDIVTRIDALLHNTPESEIEEFEVCRCLRDAKAEIERLRLAPVCHACAQKTLTLTDAEREAVRFCAEFCRLGDRADLAATLRGLLERHAMELPNI